MLYITLTVQKMKFSIKDFFSKCDQARSFLRVWSHLLKKSLVETSLFLCSDCSLMSLEHFGKKSKLLYEKLCNGLFTQINLLNVLV